MASSSCLATQCKYEVFLSFRGEDTRDNFTSHLFAALSRKKIRTFIDEELKRGDEISPALLDAIEGSKIALVIFSKDYASSKWCLNELVKILECKKVSDQIVIPIFYHVTPSDVRKQTESFEKNFKEMPKMVQKWRAVLTEASYLSGYESPKIRPEAKLVDVIVKDILNKLEHISVSSDSEASVGLSTRIEQIKSLLCIGLLDFRILGIWGMGGIGKTTIAKALFNQISSEFEGKCFMANVREQSEKGVGLIHLQKHVVSQLLEECYEIGGPNIPQYSMERLRRMKVFVVFDDVNKFDQLEYLAGGLDRFGLGSRIIVTTRDKRVLDKYGVGYIYEFKGLNYHEALELFHNYAFRQNYFPQDLMVLSERVVDYAKGNPLALKVLGSFLHRKSKLDWENALDNLKRISDPDIYDVLKISYNELKFEEKSIYLDIACFFEGEDKNYVTQLLDEPNLVHYGLNVLIDKSLLTISDNKLQMHNLLRDMGREIIRQESIREPGKRSRLWYHEDVYHVLKKNKGTDSIEGIYLDMSKIRDLHLTSGVFAKLSNLRLLKFYIPKGSAVPDMISTVYLPQGLEYLSDELRYLHWHGYPLKMLPSNFSPENLIKLCLPYSKVEQLWDGEKEAFKLKSIDLHHSKDLARLPEPLKIPNLEKINLLKCTKLPYIPSGIQYFNNLSILRLEHCKSLRCFPSNIHFRSLITLILSYCVNLTQFPQISGSIKRLDLEGTAIEEIPSSIESLTKLEMLNLHHCKMLKNVSTSICKLKSLWGLCLLNCSKLEGVPEILEKMECLEYLHLESTNIKELPSSIEHLEGLIALSLKNCSKVEKLPENLGNLKSLNIIDIEGSAVIQLPSSITHLNKLTEVRFSGGKCLILPPLLCLSSLTSLYLRDCNTIEIPQVIGCASSLRSLDLKGNNLEILPASIKKLSQLRSLCLSDCNMLPLCPEYLEARNCKRFKSLPELPSCLEELDAFELQKNSECSTEFSIPGMEFVFTNCLKLNQKAFNNVLGDPKLRIQHTATGSLRLFYEKKLHSPLGISICLPGSETPDWFSYQSSGSSVTIQLPQYGRNRRFIGFVLCVALHL